MSLFFPATQLPKDRLRSRLMFLAGLFLFLFSLILTLSPAVRIHSWQTEYRFEHWIGFITWLVGFSFIHRQINRYLPQADPYIFPSAALLIGWGLLTVFRLNIEFGLRQTLWLVVGFGLIYAGLRFPRILEILRRYKYVWLVTGLLVTALTFFFGQYPNGEGPRLWFGIGGIFFQPSEPLKLLLVIYLAAYLADQFPTSFNWVQILAPTLFLATLATLLLVAQRDLGTASLLIILYTFVIFLASGKKTVLIASLVALIGAALAGYFFFAVIQDRVDSWVNPWLDPSGKSYQIIQSIIAVATGRLFGTGPGLGSPGLIPVVHSDFITAAIVEETGLMGLVGILLLFGLIAFRGIQAALRTSNRYHRFLAAGISVYFPIQAVLIMGGNLRLLPLTGVTLPFVSYGGSSLTTSLAALVLLLLVSGQSEDSQPVQVNPQPFLIAAGLIGAALSALALLAGWWGILRSESLQFRPENLRWAIHTRYVPRGEILDRNNQPIAVNQGTPGNLSRYLNYPLLGTTIGYNNPLYGKSGLEASLDSYLTGIQGSPASTVWLAEWIYGQPPPGLNVRLSLDMNIQQKADELLGEQAGAVVLANASTGEILAMASHPTVNPNQIEEDWELWSNDPTAPLLNRVTQGLYVPGTILAPFLLARTQSTADLPEIDINQLSYQSGGETIGCAVAPSSPVSWESAVSAGCPGAIMDVASGLTVQQIENYFTRLGFLEVPPVPLPSAQPSTEFGNLTKAQLVLGDPGFKVTPLQMVLAVAALTNKGVRPGPRLAIAVETSHQGWVVLPSTPVAAPIQINNLSETLLGLSTSNLPVWGAAGKGDDGQLTAAWYIAGTLPNWQGTPLAVVVVLENGHPQTAREIGEKIIQFALQP